MRINSKQEYYQAMAEIESHLQKGLANLSTEEDAQLDQLSRAAEAWELNEYPMPLKPDLLSILNFIMYSRQLNQTQLSEMLHISKASLSEIINGKKKPNLEMVKQLHQQFQLDGNLILDSV